MVVVNLLGIKLNPNEPKSFSRAKVEVDAVQKIDKIRALAAERFNMKPDVFDLIYCGNLLTDNQPITKYGIKQGVTVHVVRKDQLNPNDNPDIPPLPVSEATKEFEKLKSSVFFFQKLPRLSRPQIVQHILAWKVPGLSNDMVSLAFLHDTELMSQLAEDGVFEKVIKSHQPVIDAVIHLARSNDARITDMAQNGERPIAYMIDNLSDDDMDSSSSEGQAGASNAAAPAGEQSITAQQLAFALSQAVTSALSPTAAAGTPGTSSSGSNTSSGGVITNEMFTSAMQLAFANFNAPATTPVTVNTTPPANERERYSAQLRQMQDLGLSDVFVNLQALRAANGDLQAAIDLVFSNFMSTDSD